MFKQLELLSSKDEITLLFCVTKAEFYENRKTRRKSFFEIKKMTQVKLSIVGLVFINFCLFLAPA